MEHENLQNKELLQIEYRLQQQQQKQEDIQNKKNELVKFRMFMERQMGQMTKRQQRDKELSSKIKKLKEKCETGFKKEMQIIKQYVKKQINDLQKYAFSTIIKLKQNLIQNPIPSHNQKKIAILDFIKKQQYKPIYQNKSINTHQKNTYTVHKLTDIILKPNKSSTYNFQSILKEFDTVIKSNKIVQKQSQICQKQQKNKLNDDSIKQIRNNNNNNIIQQQYKSLNNNSYCLGISSIEGGLNSSNYIGRCNSNSIFEQFQQFKSRELLKRQNSKLLFNNDQIAKSNKNSSSKRPQQLILEQQDQQKYPVNPKNNFLKNPQSQNVLKQFEIDFNKLNNFQPKSQNNSRMSSHQKHDPSFNQNQENPPKVPKILRKTINNIKISQNISNPTQNILASNNTYLKNKKNIKPIVINLKNQNSTNIKTYFRFFSQLPKIQLPTSYIPPILNGFGILIHPVTFQQLYRGMFKNGLFQGRGRLKGFTKNEIQKDNILWVYQGQFKKGIIDGIGSLAIINTKSRFIGRFQNNDYEGQGTFYFKKDGQQRSISGVWSGGKLIKQFESEISETQLGKKNVNLHKKPLQMFGR